MDSNKNSIIIDVRSQEGYTGELGHIPGALLRPLPEINQWMEEFKDQKNPEFIMVCRSGNRSARATKLLREHGISNVKNMRGGMLEWNRIKLPIENTIGDDKGVKDKKN